MSPQHCQGIRRRKAESPDVPAKIDGGVTGEHGRKDRSPERPRRRWMFWSSPKTMLLLGTTIGAFLGGKYLVQNREPSDLTDNTLQWLFSHRDLLPGGLWQEVEDLSTQGDNLSESFAVGLNMAKEGYSAKFPVVLVPGVISTSLESWGLNGTAECPSKQNYRKRLWGSWYMIRTMLLEKNCWLQHIMLDPHTGLDPPHYKIRAAQGMEAADFFITGYWIWNKIIENLSALGYDPNTLSLAAYDWRLGYIDLERRDAYFSRLQGLLEENLRKTGEKSVLIGHSMGSQVIFYFLKWAEAEGYGNGGSNWVNDHVEAFVDISGSMLGTPKALVSLLSGEMKDTVQLNALAVYGLEKFFARHERALMLQTMPGIASMLPKGGDTIWGTLDGAPDDITSRGDQLDTFGNFIRFEDPKSGHSERNLTVVDSFQYLYNHTPSWFVNRTESLYSFGLAKTRKQVASNERDQRTWSNPLEVALPNAPDMKIYCLYGVGKDTERSYYYKDTTNDLSTPLNATIDSDNPHSVVMSEGDGTVSLLTHTMCYRWQDKDSKFNPGKVQVKVVEMKHAPDKYDIRGGAQTAEHVDILGRTELNEMVGKIAAGRGDEITPRTESNIKDWVWNIDLGE